MWHSLFTLIYVFLSFTDSSVWTWTGLWTRPWKWEGRVARSTDNRPLIFGYLIICWQNMFDKAVGAWARIYHDKGPSWERFVREQSRGNFHPFMLRNKSPIDKTYQIIKILNGFHSICIAFSSRIYLPSAFTALRILSSVSVKVGIGSLGSAFWKWNVFSFELWMCFAASYAGRNCCTVVDKCRQDFW